jgi:hypothetical protein
VVALRALSNSDSLSAALLGFSPFCALPIMPRNSTDGRRDEKQPEPTGNTSNGNGQEKPGLTIDVILPKKEPDADPDLGKKHSAPGTEKAADFRRLAGEAIKDAQAALDPQTRKSFEDVAQNWLRLAALVERRETPP